MTNESIVARQRREDHEFKVRARAAHARTAAEESRLADRLRAAFDAYKAQAEETAQHEASAQRWEA
jgi:hypothetical protein